MSGSSMQNPGGGTDQGAQAAAQDALDRLVGLDWWGHGRSVEMADFHFGAPVEIEDRHGVRTVGEYALHIQAPWRLMQGNSVLVESAQVFEPVFEDTPWDVENRRDHAIRRALGGREPPGVEAVVVETPERFVIDLTGGMRLEISARADAGEAWRLLVSPGRNGPHFVVERDRDRGGEARWD